jgi:nucleotide-binding universal stress UspA family protein
MRILIAYDGSQCADAAIDDLLRAGLPLRAEALVLSVADVVPLPAASSDRSMAARVARSERNAALEDAVLCATRGRERLEALLPTWECDADACADSPSWAILAKANSWKADLVVMGSHGRSSVGRAVFGSVAQSVLCEAPCSVRIARGRPSIERPGGVRLVVGVDASRGAEAAVSAVLSRAWPAGSAVRVVTAVNPAVLSAFASLGSGHDDPWAWVRTVNSVAAQKFAAAGVEPAQLVVEGDPKSVLVGEASAWGADSIFLGEHGLHGADRELLGSVSAAVAARAHCSVEVVTVRRTAG